MKVCNYLEIEPVEELPGVLKRVPIGIEDGAPRFIMRIFDVEPGSSTPFHSHKWEHEVFILSGEGIVKSKDNGKPVLPGTAVFVAPDEEHCFTNTGKDILRFICVIPIEEQVV